MPQSELRGRDPRSGDRKPVSGESKEGGKSSPPTIDSFSVRGRYGVALKWTDGRHEDIFSFEALRRIAIEVETGK